MDTFMADSEIGIFFKFHVGIEVREIGGSRYHSLRGKG
jgi:hypothetical protein